MARKARLLDLLLGQPFHMIDVNTSSSSSEEISLEIIGVFLCEEENSATSLDEIYVSLGAILAKNTEYVGYGVMFNGQSADSFLFSEKAFQS